MATPKDVVWERDPHTAIKHQMLQTYLQAWFPIIAKGWISTGLTFVDAFAGPGDYSDGAVGSPIIALQQASRTEVTQHGGPLRLLLIEQDKRRFEHLQALITKKFPAESRPPQWDLRVQHGDCREALLDAMTAMNTWTGPMFVNCDGWGVDTPYEIVERVGAVKSSEVLITLQTQFLVRFTQLEDLDTGDRVFGDTAWRSIAGTGTPNEKKRNLVDYYRQRLNDANFSHTLTFELVDEGGHALFLIFGTQSELGVSKMKDAMWRVDRIQGSHFRDPRDVNQMTFDVEEHPNLTVLKSQILARLEGGNRTLEDLKNFALVETVFKGTHAVDAVTQLAADGKVLRSTAKKHADVEVSLPPKSLFDQ
jgi:three-Cys-motif partner protein